tara:strand:+ start:3873 stop:5633 length:1761 start_codon:yes stop_codon:yes gene_type:complete
MQNFAEQCLDLARSVLSKNLGFVKEDGSIDPAPGEETRVDESGHAALALGEYFRATNETSLEGHDLNDLSARCITYQAFANEENENGLAYASLGLLSFGASKERNGVWERLLDPTREQLDRRLLARSDYDNHQQAFNVAKSVARFSLGLSKKDETGKLIDRFTERIEKRSTGGFFDDHPEGFGSVYDIYGVLSFVFMRQALQLHANVHLKDRKLPRLRTYAEKYLRIIPDLTRQDGVGWNYGRSAGAYGQLHCISLILQAMRDGWVNEEKTTLYLDCLRRLFQFLFVTFFDQEEGYLVIRDEERSAMPHQTTRMANFDTARYLCQWSRLARVIGSSMSSPPPQRSKVSGRYVIFDKSHRKEHGLFIYRDENSGLQLQLPLIGMGKEATADNLAFPHCPGIFDWPTNKYLPIMLPELTFGDRVVVPSFYGKNCVTGLGLRKAFYFRYEQPDLVDLDGNFVHGLGSCKVNWTFSQDQVTSEFVFQVKTQVQMDYMRYVLALGGPHTKLRLGTTLTQGKDGLRTNVERDDFQATWAPLQNVEEDPDMRSSYGKIRYLQVLQRDYPLIMRPGQQYALHVTFRPDIAFADE